MQAGDLHSASMVQPSTYVLSTPHTRNRNFYRQQKAKVRKSNSRVAVCAYDYCINISFNKIYSRSSLLRDTFITSYHKDESFGRA